jgi:hypothetical protein
VHWIRLCLTRTTIDWKRTEGIQCAALLSSFTMGNARF